MEVLITEFEDYSPVALNSYTSIANVSLLKDAANLSVQLENVDVIVIRLKYNITKQIIDYASRLKYIISPTTGLDHIDTAYATEKGIRIISLKGETEFLQSIPSTAEHTWGLLLALMRNIPAAAKDVIEGNWNRQIFRGNNLRGKKIGILGLGRVGKQVAKYAAAFGMEIMAYDTNQPLWVEGVMKAIDEYELLRWCDILLIHIPLPGNENYLSSSLLQHLKKGAFIINTSRGGVWDETIVLQLLISGRLAGVATDVVKGEQDGTWHSSPLVKAASQLKNLIVTPHIAGATIESMHATENFVAEKFLEIVQKQ